MAVIKITKELWEKAEGIINVNNYLKSLGCDPTRPVSLAIILEQLGVKGYPYHFEDGVVANLEYNEHKKKLLYSMELLSDEKKFCEILAYTITLVLEGRKTTEEYLKNPPEKFLRKTKRKVLKEMKIQINPENKYANKKMKYKEIRAAKDQLANKFVEILTEPTPENINSYVNISMDVPETYVEELYSSEDKLFRDRINFAQELATRDENYPTENPFVQ